jgi:hypothetical protein
MVPKWFRNGSVVVPKWFRGGSVVVPQWFRGGSEVVPQWSVVVLKWFKNECFTWSITRWKLGSQMNSF